MYHPPDFSRVFHDGEIFKYPPPYERTIQIKLVSLGDIVLPTGKIVAFDPSYGQFEAFDVSVPAGRYPVLIALAHFGDEYKNICVGSTMIRFQEQEAVRWEIALLPKQVETNQESDDFYCYGVDAGLGCFADKKAATMLVDKWINRANYHTFIDELDKNSVVPYLQCVNMILDSETQLNICIFSSGYGDGCYPSYWGIGADGSIVALATDFMLGDVDEEDEE